MVGLYEIGNLIWKQKFMEQINRASDSEFILPKDIVINVHIFGMSDEEAVKLKSQSKPEETMSNGWNSLTV